jgi:hypothetical protein
MLFLIADFKKQKKSENLLKTFKIRASKAINH